MTLAMANSALVAAGVTMLLELITVRQTISNSDQTCQAQHMIHLTL